jgi:hypothetical protein
MTFVKRLASFLLFCSAVFSQQITPQNVQPSAKQGNGNLFQLSKGAVVEKHCAQFDVRGNTVDFGNTCSNPGAVMWVHDPSGVWTVTKPDGTLLSIAGSTSNGLQEALNYAFPNGYPLFGFGDGPLSTTITHITATVNVPATALGSADFYGMNWSCDVTGTAECIVFDSQDMMHWDMHHSQVWSPGGSTGATWHIWPRNANSGEQFDSFFASDLSLGETAPFAGGIGVRFTPTYNPSCCVAGHGMIANNKRLHLGNINGGAYSVVVDSPGGTQGTAFAMNDITFSWQVPTVGALLVGNSSADAANIYGNVWHITGGTTSFGTVFSGNNTTGDYYELMGRGSFTIGLGSGYNRVVTAGNDSFVPITDLSGNLTNHIETATQTTWNGANFTNRVTVGAGLVKLNIQPVGNADNFQLLVNAAADYNQEDPSRASWATVLGGIDAWEIWREAPGNAGWIKFISMDNAGSLHIPGLLGTGNASVCVNATGVLYRGAPGC